MFSKAVCPVGGTSPIAVVPVVTASTGAGLAPSCARASARSEEHTSELQSPCNIVCRLLLEKKKRHIYIDLTGLNHLFQQNFSTPHVLTRFPHLDRACTGYESLLLLLFLLLMVPYQLFLRLD